LSGSFAANGRVGKAWVCRPRQHRCRGRQPEQASLRPSDVRLTRDDRPQTGRAIL